MRLIDADALYETLCHVWDRSDSEEFEQAVFKVIANAPTADRPTGEWVAKDGETACSLCGNSVSFSRTEDGWVLGKFCQTCGARMKGGVE